uniref:Uncharacterized protein n=1 Tax=Anolis carolinensis TaxID=28377 RepID=A0A803TCX3_ANOCA
KYHNSISSIVGIFFCFQTLAKTSLAAVPIMKNILSWFLFNFTFVMPNRYIPGIIGKFTFKKFCVALCMLFQYSLTFLHFHHWWKKVPISLLHFQHLLELFFIKFS